MNDTANHSSEKLVTDALGFKLDVTILFGEFETHGQHITFQDENGKVSADSPHTIKIQAGLDPAVLNGVVAHEVYHMFYSIRPLITVGEETEAEVFGELVGKIIQTPNVMKHVCELADDAENDNGYVCEKCQGDIVICTGCNEILKGCGCGHCYKGATFAESE